MVTGWILPLLLVLMLTFSVGAKRSQLLYCSACKALVEELSYSISQVDPRKMVEVGSFRLNPDGTTNQKKVPLSSSPLLLLDLLEEVCTSMSDYSLHVDPHTGRQSYRRFAPRSSTSGDSGTFPDLKDFQFGTPEDAERLKFACETVVEEWEDDIISAFQRNVDDPQLEICSKASGICPDAHQPSEEL